VRTPRPVGSTDGATSNLYSPDETVSNRRICVRALGRGTPDVGASIRCSACTDNENDAAASAPVMATKDSMGYAM
jgi:hypothetical protein